MTGVEPELPPCPVPEWAAVVQLPDYSNGTRVYAVQPHKLSDE